MIQRYYQFLNESLELKNIEVGEWIFVENDPYREAMGDTNLKNKLGQKVEYPSKTSSKIKFTEKVGNNNIFTFYNSNTGLQFEKVDKQVIEDFNNKKLLPLVRSEKLVFVLNSLDLKYKNYFYDCSYFDISDTNDSITYLPINKIGESDPWTSKSRQVMRLGKFFKKLNPKLSAADIERLINAYKSKWDELQGIEVQIVSGEDIRFWYNEKNYAKGGGKLNSSCMRHEESQKRFDLYCGYSKRINMAIILDKNKKLLGRALIWKVDKPEIIYMDRIYTVNDYMDRFFIDYADKHGMLKYDENDESNRMEMDIHIDGVHHDPDDHYYYCDDLLPYMDTFRYYYPDEDKLCSTMDHGYSCLELDDHD